MSEMADRQLRLDHHRNRRAQYIAALIAAAVAAAVSVTVALYERHDTDQKLSAQDRRATLTQASDVIGNALLVEQGDAVASVQSSNCSGGAKCGPPTSYDVSIAGGSSYLIFANQLRPLCQRLSAGDARHKDCLDAVNLLDLVGRPGSGAQAVAQANARLKQVQAIQDRMNEAIHD